MAGIGYVFSSASHKLATRPDFTKKGNLAFGQIPFEYCDGAETGTRTPTGSSRPLAHPQASIVSRRSSSPTSFPYESREMAARRILGSYPFMYLPAGYSSVFCLNCSYEPSV